MSSVRLRLLREKWIAQLITFVAFTGIAAVALILIFVAKEALPLFWGDEQSVLSKMYLPQVFRANRPAGFMWQPVSSVPKISMIPLLLGTLKVTLVSMAIAIPLGVGGALFATEFAPRRIQEWIKPLVELLAGVPSVVLGFFALMVLSSLLQEAFNLVYPLNALVAGLGLALAIVPVVFTVSEDALMAVPRSYREASLSLGATRWETAWKVVLPAAFPGVFAACVLGFGRAIGETMIVLMASGNAAIVSMNFGDSVRTMSATIAAEMGEVVAGSSHYSILFYIGVQLFVLTFLLNAVATFWVKRVVHRVQRGGR